MKRRSVTPTSLAFLDIMFCGFGAVVLLVLILNHDTVEARNETFTDLRQEVVKRQQGVLISSRALSEQQGKLAATDDALVTTRNKSEQLIKVIREYQQEIAQLTKASQASRNSVNKLSADLKRLENQKSKLKTAALTKPSNGNKIINRTGDGDRQYLTGLKVGGKRILILFDTSASMLDETVVNIIRRRNMSAAQKRNSPKWQRSLATLDWLVSQIPAKSQFQVYGFNTQATSALANRGWLQASNGNQAEAVIVALKQTVPKGGTSLYNAFAVAKTLSPRPDNILLITDGLPTQGKKRPQTTTVTSQQRIQHFLEATQALSGAIPINTILMPMEGDAVAAAAFWKLAIDTQGSFMTPSRDWP